MALCAAAHSRATFVPPSAARGHSYALPATHVIRKQQQARERATACRSSSSSTVVTSPADSAEPTTAGADIWASFAAAVSGEWEGVTASFNPDSGAIPLPEYYVPQAYRDWGVELFDWQSQSSVLADDTGVTATNRRMMPTVGCEADAIAFTQEATQLFAVGPEAASCATVSPDGSYSVGPADIAAPDLFKAAFEHCLALLVAAEGQQQQQPQRMRLRVVHNLRRGAAGTAWQLESVDLHWERYDSPYRGKLELSGCGGGMRAFASDKPLAAEALSGSWEVVSGLLYSLDASSGQCSCTAAMPGDRWAAEGLPQGLLLHPLRAWSACTTAGEDGGDVSLAAGVLLDESGSKMVVASRRLAAGRVVGVELLTLQKAAA